MQIGFCRIDCKVSSHFGLIALLIEFFYCSYFKLISVKFVISSQRLWWKFSKAFAVLLLQNPVRGLPSGLHRARRRMNGRTQARRVIRQRAPLRPTAGAAILPDQFAVDPHPQLFDRKTVIDVIILSISHTTIFEKSITIHFLNMRIANRSMKMLRTCR